MIGIVDIETTGFLKCGGKIVEVGIAGLDLETGKVSELFHSICREEGLKGRDRNAWIFQNSDLLVEDVRQAPLFTDIQPEIQSIMDSCDGVTAYNKKFDFDFFRDRGLTINNELDCPMLLATKVCKIPNKNGRKGNKWPTVEEAWAFFYPSSPYVEQHRGLDDAIHEAKIIYALHKFGHYQNIGK